jgi:hypothetical protein
MKLLNDVAYRRRVELEQPQQTMTSLVDEYLMRAQEAHVLETESGDPFMCRSYGKIARHWLELAERVRREEAVSSGAERMDPA